jgi:cell division protein FtsA
MKKHKHKQRGSLLAALDIGSSKIACFIGRVIDDSGNFEVLGMGTQISQGIKSGTVVDIDKAEAAIRLAVHAAENMASDVMKGYPLREVVVNLPGVHSLSHSHSADIWILGHEVTDNDIRRALVKAQEEEVSSEYELIHTIPVGFRIDGHDGINEPRGMYGQNMRVDIHLVTGDMGSLRNMAACIERSHLDITAFCLSSYAAGLASLVEDEIDLGCTVIDLGGGVTSMAVFQNNALVYADAIPVGGKHVTNDIAKILTTSIADAERLKKQYGSAMGASTDENELIDVPRLGEDERSAPNHIQRSLLVGIIQPRIEEIFEHVRSRLNDSGLGATLGRRVVLTGGGAELSGIRDLAQHVLDKQVRIGRPIRLSGLPDMGNGPAYATTAGLLTYISERTDEMPADIIAQVEPGTLWQRTKSWLRDNW